MIFYRYKQLFIESGWFSPWWKHKLDDPDKYELTAILYVIK